MVREVIEVSFASFALPLRVADFDVSRLMEDGDVKITFASFRVKDVTEKR